MKSRQLNKVYQMMRVSRFFYKHKARMTGSPAAKRTIKLYNEKMDDLLVYALKQKEDIKYGAKDKSHAREELTRALLYTGGLAGWYFLEANLHIERAQVDFSYTGLKSLHNLNFHSRSKVMIKYIDKYKTELKPYGVKEKDILRLHELLKQFEKTMVLPRSLLNKRKVYTEFVEEHLDELNKMQREKLDKIAECMFDSQTIKSEYRKARKYIRYKHPHGMLDAMLKWYRGWMRKKSMHGKTGAVVSRKTFSLQHAV